MPEQHEPTKAEVEAQVKQAETEAKAKQEADERKAEAKAKADAKAKAEAKATAGLIKMHRDDETAFVHPTTVAAHQNVGFRLAVKQED